MIALMALATVLTVPVARAEDVPDEDRRICRLFRYTRQFTPALLGPGMDLPDLRPAVVGLFTGPAVGGATYGTLMVVSWRQELARRAAMVRAAEAARLASAGYRTAALSEAAAAEAAGAEYFVLGRGTILRIAVGAAAVSAIGAMAVADNLLFPESAGTDSAEALAEKLEEDPLGLYALDDEEACNYLVYFLHVRTAWERMARAWANKVGPEQGEVAAGLIAWAREGGLPDEDGEVPVRAVAEAVHAARSREAGATGDPGVTGVTGPARDEISGASSGL